MKPMPFEKTISSHTLDLVKEKNEKHHYTFLLPTRFISPENAQLAYLFNEFINGERQQADRKTFRTFFVNSWSEGLQGAIKIARHYNVKQKKSRKGILMYDASPEAGYIVDPLKKGPSDALVPEITVFRSFEDLKGNENVKDSIAVVINRDNSVSSQDISQLFETCRDHGTLTVYSDTRLDVTAVPSPIHEIAALPDIVVTGDFLTDGEVPFGSFSMQEHVHKPWTAPNHCFIHSSTYAGNQLSVLKAKEKLLKAPMFHNQPNVTEMLTAISGSEQQTLRAYSSYINPMFVKLYKIMGLYLPVTSAHQSQLYLNQDNEERKVFDCACCAGSVSRGHTPGDIVSEVIETHQTKHDYWQALTEKLGELTPFDKCFPAASGAGAVDIAIILALAANPNKKKIVTFKNNYAGKTLVSLNCTDEADAREPFGPLYEDVTYLDPHDPEAKQNLTRILTSNEVALVWFELFQGFTGNEIPDDLIDVIVSQKEKYGYLVGVDEIFMGFYRSGTLFSFQQKNITPDLITLSKAISDGTFPIAAALTTKQVYDKAAAKNKEMLRYYETNQVNQLGSHIALHFIEKILKKESLSNIADVSAVLAEGLRDIGEQSPFIKEIKGKGMCYQFVYTKEGYSFMSFIASLCMKEANIFIYFNRFIPALTTSVAQAKELIEGLRKVLCLRHSTIKRKYFLFQLKSMIEFFKK